MKGDNNIIELEQTILWIPTDWKTKMGALYAVETKSEYNENRKFHMVGTILKSNRKCVETKAVQ